MGDDAIVITGGGPSPDGVKAFVTEYTGLNGGEVNIYFEDDKVAEVVTVLSCPGGEVERAGTITDCQTQAI